MNSVNVFYLGFLVLCRLTTTMTTSLKIKYLTRHGLKFQKFRALASWKEQEGMKEDKLLQRHCEFWGQQAAEVKVTIS